MCGAVGRVLRSILVLSLSCAVAGCGNPPDKELQQAQGAIDAARAAGAGQFAGEELAAAEDALRQARQAVEARDYRLALNDALDSRERAQDAARQAADRKATAREAASQVLTTATGTLNELRARLKAAETSRSASRTASRARRAVADAEAAVQEARAAFNREDYLAVTRSLGTTISALQAAARDLEAATASNSRQRG